MNVHTPRGTCSQTAGSRIPRCPLVLRSHVVNVQKWCPKSTFVSWSNKLRHIPGKNCQEFLVCGMPVCPIPMLGSWVSAGSGFHTITEQPLGVWLTVFNETIVLGYKVKVVQYEQGHLLWNLRLVLPHWQVE